MAKLSDGKPRKLTREETIERLNQFVADATPQTLEEARTLADLQEQLKQIAHSDEPLKVREAAWKAFQLSHGIDPTGDSLQFDRIFEFGQACLAVGLVPHYERRYLPKEVYKKLDISSKSLRKYAVEAGVEPPTGRGKRNHRYSEADVREICGHIVTSISDTKVVELARQWMTEIESKSKYGK